MLHNSNSSASTNLVVVAAINSSYGPDNSSCAQLKNWLGNVHRKTGYGESKHKLTII